MHLSIIRGFSLLSLVLKVLLKLTMTQMPRIEMILGALRSQNNVRKIVLLGPSGSKPKT